MTPDAPRETGPFGRGGATRVAREIAFTGSLGPAFVAFARERAARLALAGRIDGGETRVIARVEGPDALVGAFEMACSIGPDDARVTGWTVRDLPDHASRA